MRKMYLIHKILFFCQKDGFKRAEYLKKHHLLAKIGDNIFFQPRNLPGDPKLIKLGNNISIASNVIFCTHDVIHHVFNYMSDQENKKYTYTVGCIEIGDNVFVGANAIIMPNIKIGKDVIVGAGSVVTKDIKSGKIVAGNPAKEIGNYYDFKEIRLKKNLKNLKKSKEEIEKNAWDDFLKRYNN